MPELDELIATLRERVRDRSAFEDSGSGKVYSDQKIIFTADKLKTFRPPELREMRKIAQSKESIRWSGSRIFYEQARFMASFEDDKPYGDIQHLQEIYFPVYQRLNEDQLRGYFTWRTAVRHSDYDDSSTTYSFLYIYELLHNVGVDSPEEGAKALDGIWRSTSKRALRNWIAEWAADYCAYYGVDPSCFGSLRERMELENALSVISKCTDAGDEELYSAMKIMDPGNTERSVLVSEHPQEHMELSCRIIRKVAERYRKQHHREYADSFYRLQKSVSKEMFKNAVFFDYMAPRSYSYRLSDFTEYSCHGSIWSWSGLGESRRNPDIRMTFREADNLLRKHYGYSSLLKESDWKKEKKVMAAKALEEMLTEQKEKEKRTVVFDISLLDDIRRNAEKMRERLIVPGSEEEFRESDAAEAAEPVVAEEVTETPDDEVTAPEGQILTEEERELLRKILDGTLAVSGTGGIRVSVLCDSINEKLYDIVGDTVIEFPGDTPAIVEDYVDDVKGVLS